MISQQILNVAVGSGVTAKLVVFNFHNIANKDDLLFSNSISEALFNQSIKWINDNFKVLSLYDGIDMCRSGKLQGPSACITFDDGYKSHYSIATKALNALGIKGTFFATTKHLGCNLLWHDLLMLFETYASDMQKAHFRTLLLEISSNQHLKHNTIEEQLKYLPLNKRQPLLQFLKDSIGEYIKQPLMMTEDELINLNRQGHIIGAHTLHHPILSMEEPEVSRSEIVEDVKVLSSILGQNVRAFAFPNGKPNKDYGCDQLKVLQQLEIDYAVSTAPGYFEAGTDPLQIPRFGLRGRTNFGFTKCVVSNLSSPPEFVEYRGYEAIT